MVTEKESLRARPGVREEHQAREQDENHPTGHGSHPTTRIILSPHAAARLSVLLALCESPGHTVPVSTDAAAALAGIL